MMTANTLGLENILKILLGKVSELESKVEVLEDFKQVEILLTFLTMKTSKILQKLVFQP